jgi:hypothetical protein
VVSVIQSEDAYDFPVVSVGARDDPERLAGVDVGGMLVTEEELFVPAGPGTEPSDRKVGVVTIVHWKSRRDRVPFTAHFAFGPEDSDEPDIAIVSGIVPGGGTWNGRGRAAYNGGTGKFERRAGSIAILAENPKRWGS